MSEVKQERIKMNKEMKMEERSDQKKKHRVSKTEKFECCDDVVCHKDLFYDWVTCRCQDKSMGLVTKGQWRYALYTEYFTVYNYRRYREQYVAGRVDWPWNAHLRGRVPVCIGTALEKFINNEYLKQIDWDDFMEHMVPFK